ncbi:Na(+)-translocating NADH-quinone reductase subunit F [Flavobacteriaceae bacterium R38]|nr:Na(+)-translocating NADH-quinone reductase subunit F [Flavobacteriaceae bacterium R38]
MKTTNRFENAVKKLYIAFHNDHLFPECSKQCAVGNICNNTDAWSNLSDSHGSLKLNYVGLVHQNLGRKFFGYSPLELLQIEVAFLKGCGYILPLHHSRRPDHPTSKETLFKGLCAVVAFLCKLDNIDDVMDYSQLFAFEHKEHKLALEI